ncbi:Hypothetical protein A7982_07721 [Minicystis rosea]|nr:Hypothetical protein A7982_07721 [Minicystis rosea]
MWLTKIDEAGMELWQKTFPQVSSGDPSDIATDAAGNVVITGALAVDDTLDFGSGPLVAPGPVAAYIAKLSPSGDAMWSDVLGSPDLVRGSRLAIDPSSDVVLVSRCQGATTIGGVLVSPASGEENVCAIRLDASGQLAATKIVSIPGIVDVDDVALTSAGNVVIIGGKSVGNSVVGYLVMLSF